MGAAWSWTAPRTTRRAPSACAAGASVLDRARITAAAARIDKAGFTRADMVELIAAHHAARTERVRRGRVGLDRARITAAAARIDKAGFTRADMVELIAAHLPVDTSRDPRQIVEEVVDGVGLRISAPRAAHHREGHEKFTLDVIIAEEGRILDLADERANHSRLDVRSADVEGLSVDQARAVTAIATSPWLVQPLCAPAGAGKTHSLRALRTAAARAGKEVLVLAPTAATPSPRRCTCSVQKNCSWTGGA